MRFRRVHCVGIGGSGISAIARVLLEQGVQVSGSDLHLSPVARSLAGAGATVYEGHAAEHVGQAEAVLVSSAIPANNPEMVEARRRGIPVFKRAEFLGQLMTGKLGVAVAGTHGKTTTTGMLAWMLTRAGRSPTFIVGGVVKGLEVNARAGSGPHFVIEADEYDRMFLGLKPTVALVTHLEHDHPDCFPTMADMQEAFERFLALVPSEGLILGCGDWPNVNALLSRRYAAPVQRCGLNADNDWCARAVRVNAWGGHDFTVAYGGQVWGEARLHLPGLHNVRNALMAVAAADRLGLSSGEILDGLASFTGTERRFELVGEAGGVTVVDDYGHHPTEIAATLAAARARYGGRPLWAVFQPHTFSRVKALWAEFLACFGDADHVIVLDVYAARERETLGVSAAQFADELGRVHPDVRYIADFDRAAQNIVERVEPGAVVITLSAGDGNRVGRLVLDMLGGTVER